MEASKVVKLANYKSAQTKSFDEECAEAYAWILQVQKTQGWYSEPIKVTFEEGDWIESGEVIVALFVDKARSNAILCREWPDDMCIKFNWVINPNELRIRAPKSYQKMVENGLALYHKEGMGYRAMYLMEQSKKRRV